MKYASSYIFAILLSVLDGILLAVFVAAVFVVCLNTYLGPDIELADLKAEASSHHGFSGVQSWRELQELRAGQLKGKASSKLGLPKDSSMAEIRDAQEKAWPGLQYLDLG